MKAGTVVGRNQGYKYLDLLSKIILYIGTFVVIGFLGVSILIGGLVLFTDYELYDSSWQTTHSLVWESHMERRLNNCYKEMSEGR